MDDETQIVPVDGMTEAPEVSTQTTEAEVVTPQAEAPAALSLEQVERLLSERENKLRAEFEQQTRRVQSKTDKAYADALRKAKIIEESAQVLGLDEDAVKTAKQALIDKEFANAFSEQAQPPEATPQPVTGDTVSRDELVNAIRAQGLSENDVDLTKYVGASRYDSNMEQEFLDDVAIARARIAEAKRQAKINKQQAQVAGQVKQEFGKIASPAVGAPKAGYDPVAELEKMNREGPPDNPKQMQAYMERMSKLKKEAGW